MCAKSLYSCPILCCLVAQLCPTLLRPYGLQPARLLCPWDSPGKNTGAGCHAFLQEIFPTQGLNLTGSVLKNLPANAGDAGNTGSIPGTIKKARGWRTDAFKLWYWRRLLRVPWTARRSNQSILKEIKPEYSLEGLMLKLKLQYFGLMWRANPLVGKDLDAGKYWRQKEKRAGEDEMVG